MGSNVELGGQGQTQRSVRTILAPVDSYIIVDELVCKVARVVIGVEVTVGVKLPKSD